MQTAFADFQNSLNRVRLITQAIDANAGQALANASLREQHETSQCALTAILSGFFESFLSDIVEKFISIVSSRNIPFAQLPPQIQSTHLAKGGSVLNAKQRNRANW